MSQSSQKRAGSPCNWVNGQYQISRAIRNLNITNFTDTFWAITLLTLPLENLQAQIFKATFSSSRNS